MSLEQQHKLLCVIKEAGDDGIDQSSICIMLDWTYDQIKLIADELILAGRITKLKHLNHYFYRESFSFGEKKTPNNFEEVISHLIENGIWSKLTPRSVKVLMVILTKINWRTYEASLSCAEIALMIGASHDTVQRSIQDLFEVNLLDVVSEPGRKNLFRLVLK